MEKLQNKKALVLALAAIGAAVAVDAQAASVITTGMATSLSDGFTQLQDTVADVIAKVWPYMLGIMALYAAPSIVKKLWKMVVGG